jgi:hypothetical protein
MKINKAKLNYWVDVVIGLGFILSAVTGIVLFVAPSGGYQGGRNPHFGRLVLGLEHDTWKNLHNWSSLVMVAGVLGHLLLHWNWIVCMTKRVFGGSKRKDRPAESCPTDAMTLSPARETN